MKEKNNAANLDRQQSHNVETRHNPSSPSTPFSSTEAESKNITYPPRNLSFYLAFLSVCTCTFIATIDTVIVATALPAITHALHATSNEAYWCGTGFLFAQTVSQPLYGAFQEVVGHKRIMLLALAIFLITSVLCATAQSISWLVASRVVQGIGGGGSNAMVNVLVSDMVPLHERGTFSGLVNLFGAVGLVSGVVLGAAFAEKSTWRLIFYINIPITLLAATGILLCLRMPRRPALSSLRTQLARIDYVGATLWTCSLTAVLYGITAGGVLYPWSHARIISSLVIGTLGLVFTSLYEYFFASHPMIPPRVFKTRTAASGYFISWAHGAVLWALAYYLILYFLIARGHGLLHAAVEILPGIASIPACAVVAGVLMAVLKRYKWMNVLAWVSLAIGIGLLSTLEKDTGLGKAYGYQIILALGGGIVFPGRILAVQVAQRDEDVPIATTMVSFFTSLGEAFGVGIGGSIFQNRWEGLTERYVRVGVLPERYLVGSHAAEGAAQKIKELPFDVQEVYREVMSKSLRTLWIVFAALSAVGFVVSIAQRDLSLAENKSDAGDGEYTNGCENGSTKESRESSSEGSAPGATSEVVTDL